MAGRRFWMVLAAFVVLVFIYALIDGKVTFENRFGRKVVSVYPAQTQSAGE